MKSLQVLTPTHKCIFSCPFCISKTHPHNNQFESLYDKDRNQWKKNLEEILVENKDLKTVVITGTSEPMQEEACVLDIIHLTRQYRKDVSIEIQTRYYGYKKAYDLVDVTAYSISSFSYLSKIVPLKSKVRATILLTDSFNDKSLQDIIKALDSKVEQITFKVLHDSHGYNKEIDAWIHQHSTSIETVEKLKKEIENYKGKISIFFDENCMDADNRYRVFREDGRLYKDYESREYL